MPEMKKNFNSSRINCTRKVIPKIRDNITGVLQTRQAKVSEHFKLPIFPSIVIVRVIITFQSNAIILVTDY